MTFICELYPYSLDIYGMCKNELVKAFKSYPITACECMRLVRRDHFPSRDKDGGHTIGSTISENPMLHANLMALSLIEPELWAIEVLNCGNGNFWPFWPLKSWPWPDDVHIRAWRVLPGDTPDVQIRQGFRKLTSDRHADREISYAWSLPVTWQRWRSVTPIDPP